MLPSSGEEGLGGGRTWQGERPRVRHETAPTTAKTAEQSENVYENKQSRS
jgi:hypothetical protein